MKAKAEIEFKYKNAKIAQQISYLLEIDNAAAYKKLIKTESRGRRVVTHIEHENLNTFLATIDDLLFCERLIEELICWT